jgi:hypothetical protein
MSGGFPWRSLVSLPPRAARVPHALEVDTQNALQAVQEAPKQGGKAAPATTLPPTPIHAPARERMTREAKL